MGRLSRIGGAMLGAAVALDAGEALSQEKPNQELPQKGYFPEDPAELNNYRYALLDKVVLDDDSSEAASAQREAEKDLELVRREAGQVTTYWELSFRGLDPVSGEPIFEYVRPSGPGLNPVRECIATDHYVDTFPIRSTGQTVLVLDRKDQFDHVTCPELPEAPTRVEITPPSEPPVPEYVPHAGKFADLEPSLVKNGVFLVPILTMDASEEVPVELTTSAYTALSTHGGMKRTVYREYILEDYKPKTGILRVRDSGDASKCMETRTFKDQIIGNRTSYLLSEPGSPEMKDVACKEEAAPKPVSETPVKESKPWELPVRAGLAVGADIEETSEYSLGNAPALHASAQTRPFGIPLELGLSGDFIFTEQGSGLEGLDLMVGGQPVQKVPVRAYLTVGDSFEARDRYQETTLNGAFSYGVLVDGDVYKFNLLDQALAVNCRASAQQHLYGGGSPSAWNVAGGCGVVLDLVVSGGGKEKKERPVVSDAAVSAVAVEAQPKGPHLEMETKPYSYEIPAFKETKDEEKKAKRVQLSEEMRKKAERNAWDAVEHSYGDLTKLKVPLSFGTYKTGAEAARALGDIEESYERILVAQSVAATDAEKKATADWIADVEPRYASVEITVDVEGEVTFAPVDYGAFAPDIRAAIVFVQAELAKDGSFEGFLPTSEGSIQITYTLNGQIIKELPPVSSKVTTEIRLEK